MAKKYAAKVAAAEAGKDVQLDSSSAPLDDKALGCSSSWKTDTSPWCPEGGCGGWTTVNSHLSDNAAVLQTMGWGDKKCTTEDCCSGCKGECGGSGGCCYTCFSDLDNVNCEGAMTFFTDAKDAALDFGRCRGFRSGAGAKRRRGRRDAGGGAQRWWCGN